MQISKYPINKSIASFFFLVLKFFFCSERVNFFCKTQNLAYFTPRKVYLLKFLGADNKLQSKGGGSGCGLRGRLWEG